MTKKKTEATTKPVEAQKTDAKPKVSKTTTKAKKAPKSAPSKAKKPDYPAILDMKVPEFKVGTPEYAELIRMGNSLFNTVWNTHRVRPAVFYGIYKKLRDHYNVPTNVK